MNGNDLIVISNFAKFNQSIYFNKGNKLRVSKGSNSYLEAGLETSFPIDFTIFDVPKLIQILKTFKTYKISYLSEGLLISSGNSSIMYRYPSEGIVQEVRELNLPEPEIEFKLSSGDIKNLQRFPSILSEKSDQVLQFNVDDTLKFYVSDGRSSSHKFEYDTKVEVDKNISDVLALDRMDILQLDYEVGVYPGKAIRFKNDEFKVKYIFSFKD